VDGTTDRTLFTASRFGIARSTLYRAVINPAS